MHSPRQGAGTGYDDVDSITELVLEQLLDDDDCIPDNDDDSNGMPKNNGLEKFSWNPLCCQLFQKVTVIPSNKINQSAPRIHQEAYPTCKGYFNIVSPPPDQLAA